MKAITAYLRNLALIAFAMALSNPPAQAQGGGCDISPGGCVCCNDPYPCCYVYCGPGNWCDCCGDVCHGPNCE